MAFKEKIMVGFAFVSVFSVFGASEAVAGFKPGEVWPDTDGQHINAHGGGMLHHNGVYYWFGEFKGGGKKGNKAYDGVNCYSSTNLVSWKNEGIALAMKKGWRSEIKPGCVMERPKVVYNEKTGKFVMWFHLELKGKGYKAARTGVAVSDDATGPYTYLRSFRPNAGTWPANYSDEEKACRYPWWLKQKNARYMDYVKQGYFLKRDLKKGQMSRDMTLFVDDDGKAYHIHSAEENYTLNISELTDDYTDFTDNWIRILPGGHNEAPAIFKRKGRYYMITSGCMGWDPNEARLFVADSVMGEWTYLGNPCIGEDAGLTFHSQSTYVLPVQGIDDAFIFMADRWNPKNQVDSRYIWLPVLFKGDVPYLKWMDEWNLDFFRESGQSAEQAK